ncbi:MAG: hypothetical protein JWL59_2020 [Chthoniobacteraceae bacterium]|nr:hypothetical protein [Chthoniobacteraceae bacterium]
MSLTTRALLSALLLPTLFIGHLDAQLAIPADVNFFAGGAPSKRFQDSENNTIQSPEAKALPHALLFHDGRQLRGELLSLTATEVILKRPDASEPLRIPRDGVRRIVLAEPPENETPLFFQVRSIRRDPGQKSRRLIVATVKLKGGGWFCGELSSADGETFSLKLEGKSAISLKRDQIEWFYFDSKPMSAFEFTGSLLDAKGWLLRAPSARAEIIGRTLVVSGAESFSRPITLAPRFEVQFEVPADAQAGLRLWIQASLEPPGSYTRGSMELQLGEKEAVFGLFTERFEKQTVPFKEEAPPEAPVRYRFLYDGFGQRVSVLRDDKPLGSWPLPETDNSNRPAPFQFLGFDRTVNGEKAPLKFNAIRVGPWDGMVPDGTPGDRLSVGRQSAIPGSVTEVTERSLVFAGKKGAVAPEVFYEFASDAAPAALEMEGKLTFGFGGELNAASLEIHDGKAVCKTAFASAFEVPIDVLQVVTFNKSKPSGGEPADTLVFKNGDQFRGTLLPSGSDGPVHWKTSSGQAIEFQLPSIAGVRFAAPAQAAAEGTSVDLRNGDRLRGEMVKLDKTGLTLLNPAFGRLILQRDQLWRVYPDPKLNFGDGTNEGAIWRIGKRRIDNVNIHDFTAAENRGRWMIFNGFYLLHPEENDSSGTPPGDNIPNQLEELQAPPSLTRNKQFEIRAELSNAGGNDIFSILMLEAEKDAPFMTVVFNSDQLQAGLVDPKHPEASQQKSVNLEERIAGKIVRMAVRIFVDSELGTADFYINGAPLLRMGQKANERLPGLGRTVSFSAFPVPLTVFSNLWIGPWNGELPQPDGTDAPRTILSNGDVAADTPAEFRENRFFLESEIGPIEIERDKVQSLDFGGTMTPGPNAAARVLLSNGSSLNLSAFKWEGGELVATSQILGELRLPAGIVRELIYSPPMTPPLVVLPEKKPARTILR